MITTICYVEVCIVKARAEPCEPLRRGRQDIIMGILTIAKHGARKTEMIDKVRMSSAQCTQYLEDLKDAGYISEESGTWRTTEKGLQVIDACKICHSLMNLT
jgi:predicted transcriptional regulator